MHKAIYHHDQSSVLGLGTRGRTQDGSDPGEEPASWHKFEICNLIPQNLSQAGFSDKGDIENYNLKWRKLVGVCTSLLLRCILMTCYYFWTSWMLLPLNSNSQSQCYREWQVKHAPVAQICPQELVRTCPMAKASKFCQNRMTKNQ
jgi:hypothetical protein